VRGDRPRENDFFPLLGRPGRPWKVPGRVLIRPRKEASPPVSPVIQGAQAGRHPRAEPERGIARFEASILPHMDSAHDLYVAHACRLLAGRDRHDQEIDDTSAIPGTARTASAFERHVGGP
jgi:hypothetical protein